DVRDVRMIEGRSGRGLLLEPAHSILVGREIGRQDFECNLTVQPRVLGKINFAHSALADLRADLVAAQWCAGFEDHLALLISATSEINLPRDMANCLPSGDRSNVQITSDLKSVNCTGLPPSIGWLQMLDAPPMSAT